MSLLRNLQTFKRGDIGNFARLYYIKIIVQINENCEVYINPCTFAVVFNGKRHKIYSSKKLPKHINFRTRVFC